MTRMRTVDKQFTTQTSRGELLRRDGRLLWRMIRMLYAYLVVGGCVRRAYRAKEARGEIYWLDERESP